MSRSVFLKSAKRIFWRLLLIGFTLFFFLVIYLDSLVRHEFTQRAWNIPAKVYARPLAFSLAKKLTLKDLKAELNLLGYRKTIKAVNQGEYEQYENTLVINTRRFKFWDGLQPEQILEVTIEQGKIVALKDFASQKMVNFLRLDPLSLGSIQTGSQEDRQLVKLAQLPVNFVSALLNTEDREFYHHWGISIKGIARASWSNFSAGSVRQGGSTLTQQLIKNHFLSRERSLWRKFREAIMAVLTEFHYSKEVILQAYINEIYLGQNNTSGIHGFARASEFYFDKPIEKINLSQIALLVAMVKGPSLYNPRSNPQLALERRNLVLTQMFEQGLIIEQEYQDALSNTLQVVTKPKSRSSRVPAFMGYIKRELSEEYTLSELHQNGLRLFTSLDPLIQKNAELSLQSKLNQLEKYSNGSIEQLQGALIVSDIANGDILAMVGDRNPNYVGFNRAIDAYRQTGSVIKPFVYLTALKQSHRYNLLTPLQDEAFSLKGNDGSLWSPNNYDNQPHGRVELREALINSYNLATARLAMEVGVDEVVNTITKAGFDRELVAFPSIALGAKEMSPLEVTRLYQTIANNGVGVRPTGLTAVQDHQGNLLQRYRRKAEARFEPADAFLIQYLLAQVVNSGTAKAIGETFAERQYAGKTGTTNDLRDSWYAGFGGEKLAVVWLGRDDNQPSQLTGSSGALQVWKDLFLKLEEPAINLSLPENLVWGYQPGGFFSNFSDCHNKKRLPFYLEQLPQDYKTCD